MTAVLDASTILAVLNRETGWEAILPILPGSLMSSVNLAEVITKLALGGMPVGESRSVIHGLGVTIMPLIDDLAFRVGALILMTAPPGLSLGDRACIALAEQHGGEVWTGDRAWANANLSVQVHLIR